MYKRHGRRATTTDTFISESGTKVKKRKNIPANCNTPKRICIKCATAVISKLDKCYDSKVCKACTAKETE